MHTMRTVGLILLGIMVGCAAALVALILWLGPVPGALTALALAAATFGVYVAVAGPWQRRWGATDEELHRPLPGDGRLPAEASSTTRAITIDAPPEDVFPWLLQIGFGRGGWYSYDWIDNDGRPSVDRIDPTLRVSVGERIEMLPGFGPTVREIEPNHHIVSGGDTDSWCLLVEPTQEGGTRLVSRWRQAWPTGPATSVWVAIVDPGAFIMERKMLRRIKELAERRRTLANADARSRL